MYYHNYGDNFDEDGQGAKGFGKHPPAMGITFLQGAKMDKDGKDNASGVGINESVNGTGFDDGIVDNEYWGMENFVYYNNHPSPQGNPITATDFYNYMHGIWRDGAAMTYGANGKAGTTAYKYMFPSYSDTAYWYGSGGIPQTAPWTERTAGFTPGDRRGVASTGPFTLKPGEKQIISVAYVYGRDLNDTNASAGVKAMLQNVDSIRYYYNKNIKPCGGNFTGIKDIKQELKVYVYPNPFNEQIKIITEKPGRYTAQLYDMMGKKIKEKTFNQQRFILNTDDLSKGIYLLKVRGNNSVKTFKMVH